MEQSKTSAGISAESAAKARSEISITRRYFADMLILMVVPAVMAWYYYGGRAVRLLFLMNKSSPQPCGEALRSRRLVYFQSSSLCFRPLGGRHGPYDSTLYARVRSVLSAVHSLGFCRYRRKAAVRQCAFSYVYASSGRHSLCHNMYAG